jgi:hypothetical protein
MLPRPGQVDDATTAYAAGGYAVGHLGLGVVVDGVGLDEMELLRRDGVAALALGGPGGLHVDGLAVVVDEVLEGGLGVLELCKQQMGGEGKRESQKKWARADESAREREGKIARRHKSHWSDALLT